jgi:hypothetical protein
MAPFLEPAFWLQQGWVVPAPVQMDSFRSLLEQKLQLWVQKQKLHLQKLQLWVQKRKLQVQKRKLHLQKLQVQQ